MIVPSAAASLLAVALWATGAVARTASAPARWAKKGGADYQPPKPAPAFTLPGLDGRTVSLDDQKGKALLLFFWATW